MKKIFLFTLIFTTISCSTDDSTNSRIIFNHHYETGFGFHPRLIFLTQEGSQLDTDDWSYFYDGIEGFTYEPGYIYDLSINKSPINNPLADQGSVKYRLNRIFSKVKVDDDITFQMKLKFDGFNFVENNTGYTILNQIDINCNNLCNELDNRLLNQADVIGIFQHGADGSIELLGFQ
ncbi:MAG: DUF4377 domain-containing protein [Nonlabens sp.]|uniref:DUF4377 domain-containing protein n=1 Tax=Nonlabens sp. TaxID=1888209 RepID=UPI003EF2C46B